MMKRRRNIEESCNSMYCTIGILLMVSNLQLVVDARTWRDLDIPVINDILNVDPLYAPGSKLLIEDDVYSSFKLVDDSIQWKPPLQQATNPPPPTNDNIDIDIESSSSVDYDEEADTTEAVQMVNSAPLSDQPTFSPSKSYEAANGNCPSNHNLYRLWLYDSEDDGWGSSQITIKETTSRSSSLVEDAIFVGTLNAARGVIKFDTSDVSSSRAHSKSVTQAQQYGYHNKQQRQRDLQVGVGGTISGPSGSITWDEHGNASYCNGVHCKDSLNKDADGSDTSNPQGNTPEQGYLEGGSGSIQWGSKSGNTNTNGDVNSSGNDLGRDSKNIDGGANIQHIKSDGDSNEPAGYTESVYLCLNQHISYTVEITGGTFLEETSWEITRVELGTGDNIGLVASGTGGGSLGYCSFCLDGSCEKTCDGTAQVFDPTGSPTTKTPSEQPSSSPVGTPTISPSKYITKKPINLMMDAIDNEDDRHAYNVKEYVRIQNVITNASPSSKQTMMATDKEYQAFDANEETSQFRAFEWVYMTDESGLSDEHIVQRWVLASFYYATNGDDWVDNTNWLEPLEHECTWYGVTCLDGKVSKLELGQNRLVGEIVPEIALFASTLYILSLGNDYDYDAEGDEKNELVMPLPSFLSDLPSLKNLNLENVGLIGSIPRDLFSSWSHLNSLYLNGNDITGTLPVSIKHLSSIEVLWLGGNNLGGPIIPELGDLVTLKDLDLADNFRKDTSGRRGFITAVPPEINQLTNLESLSLSDNALSGLVPQLGDLISLRRLQLSGNFFEGQLPPALGRLEMLEELDLSYNWLSSTIPPEYGNMVSLASLNLAGNYNDQDGYFTWGVKNSLPTELGQLKNLQHLNLADNYISGTLISELGQLFRLQSLHLQNNVMQGPIPDEYSNCVSLKELLLQNNDIDGSSYSMPNNVCRLPKLELARVDCDVSCSCCLSTC